MESWNHGINFYNMETTLTTICCFAWNQWNHGISGITLSSLFFLSPLLDIIMSMTSCVDA